MWSSLLQTSQKYKDQPVVFIAVNSGTDRNKLERYVLQNKITWPVIVDTDREFEQLAQVNTISLENIYQARVLTPEGKLTRGSVQEVGRSIEPVLKDAKWKIPRNRVPVGLESNWRGLEFGDIPADAAQSQFEESVMKALEQDAARFWQLGRQRNRVGAYRIYLKIQRRFQGYDLPERLTKAGAWLEKQPELQAVINSEQEKEKAERRVTLANNGLDHAKKQLSVPATRKQGIFALKRIIISYPETDAATEAESLLQQVTGR